MASMTWLNSLCYIGPGSDVRKDLRYRGYGVYVPSVNIWLVKGLT